MGERVEGRWKLVPAATDAVDIADKSCGVGRAAILAVKLGQSDSEATRKKKDNRRRILLRWEQPIHLTYFSIVAFLEEPTPEEDPLHLNTNLHGLT
jgi:hypothetical protein